MNDEKKIPTDEELTVINNHLLVLGSKLLREMYEYETEHKIASEVTTLMLMRLLASYVAASNLSKELVMKHVSIHIDRAMETSATVKRVLDLLDAQPQGAA